MLLAYDHREIGSPSEGRLSKIELNGAKWRKHVKKISLQKNWFVLS